MLNIDHFLIIYTFLQKEEVVSFTNSTNSHSTRSTLLFFCFVQSEKHTRKENQHTKEKRRDPRVLLNLFACLIIPFIRSRSLQIEQ